MKICYLCQDLGISVDGQKGASAHIRGFVSALANHGNDITILTPKALEKDFEKAKIKVIKPLNFLNGLPKEDNIHLTRALKHLLFNGAVEMALREEISSNKPDFIYERLSPFSGACSIIAKQNNIPHFLEINTPLADQGKKYRAMALSDVCEYMEKTTFANTSLIFATAMELKTWLINQGVSEEKIFIRPTAVDSTLFSNEPPSIKDQFKDKIVLGFVGGLKPWHDIEFLIKAFKIIAKDPKYHLLIVGDGTMRSAIKKLIKELPDRVTWTGAINQEDVPKYVSSMDICVAPYPNLDFFYYSPLKVYEYMAAGKPVIATKIGQLNEIVQEGVTGNLINPGDINSFVEAIKRLGNDSNLRISFGKAARVDALQNHTWEKRAETFLNVVIDYLKEEK